MCFGLLIIVLFISACKKHDNPVKYPNGIFPDTVLNLTDLNSTYDDYNSALYELNYTLPIVFSSNRKSSGGQFDLEQGSISFKWDMTKGIFGFRSTITTDTYLTKLITKAVTTGNDFGPYRYFSTEDGFEYLTVASATPAEGLNLFYLKNQPASGSIIPEISGPLPVNVFNTSSNEAYLCLNPGQDTAYICSDRGGNFDIYYMKKPAKKNLSEWFNMSAQPAVLCDSLNSSGDDKCPYILKKIMVFASDRPGGMGGYDLYYSVMKGGKWSSPVNFGPSINTSYNEYRPVLGSCPGFTNNYIIFSSDRPAGKGGYDLYFTGVDLSGN